MMGRRQARGLDLFICEMGGSAASSCTLSHLWVSSEPAGSSPNSSRIRRDSRNALGRLWTLSRSHRPLMETLIHREPFFHLPASQIQWERRFPSGVLETIKTRAVLGRGTGYGHHDLIAWK